MLMSALSVKVAIKVSVKVSVKVAVKVVGLHKHGHDSGD